MDKRPTVHFSNKPEVLAEHLGKMLWQKGADPFARRLVILPHQSLKTYLQTFFALSPNRNISAGVEYKVPVEGVKSLLPPGEKIFPSEAALSFAVQKELTEILSSDPVPRDFFCVKEFAEGNQKIEWIAKELGRIFYEYCVFEKKALDLFKKEKGWKREIFDRVFQNFPNWRLLSEEVSSFPGGEESVHVFGFSHIPSHFYDFFTRFPVNFYFLSPCEMYWEDLCSDRERIYLEKKMEKGRVKLQVQEQLRFFLTKTHPLLANWGRTGKALLARFGETECYLKEDYRREFANGVLGLVQRTLLDLEDETEKVEILESDESILCVSATSKLREVEILLQMLSGLMRKTSTEPKDVLVLVPDLQSYEPFIRMVFGAKTSPFTYSIQGLSLQKDSAQSIFSFISLFENRFEIESVFRFFSTGAVKLKWNFTDKELEIFKKCFNKAGVLWGLSAEHKSYCLQQTDPWGKLPENLPKGGSWEEGIRKVLLGIAFDDKEGFAPSDWTSVEVLGRFIDAICKITEDTASLYRGEKETFSFWTTLVKKWIDTYFIPSKMEKRLLEYLDSLREELSEAQDFVFPFSSFVKIMEKFFAAEKKSFGSSLVQSIRFVSFETAAAYPAEIIYVLGCDEESLPSPEKKSSFEEGGIVKETPPASERSRYGFLELLLHARSSLIFSYVRISPKDGKNRGPCSMIQDLLSYLDAGYFYQNTGRKPSEVLTRDHPSLSFAKEYFEKGSVYKNFRFEDFLLAKSYYLEDKKPEEPFFPSWKIEVQREVSVPLKVEISKLCEFAKNPVRFYFKESLGIFFDFGIKEDGEFFLSPLLQKKILLKGLEDSLEKSIKNARLSERLPLGRWGEFAEGELALEAGKWTEGLKALGVSERDLFSIEFTEGDFPLKITETKVIAPALPVEVEGIGTVFIQGHIPQASAKGLIWIGKKKKEEYTMLWPSFLIFACLAKELGWNQECLMVYEGRKFPFRPEDPKALLSKYLKLYFRSLAEPCPVSPSLSSELLEGDNEKLQKKMESPSSYEIDFLDPYEKWIKGRDRSNTPLDTLLRWKEQWHEVFAGIEGAEDEDV